MSFLFILPSTSYAQSTDIEMAKYYYEQGDFEKAKLYYDKIYNERPSTSIFIDYLNTLVELKEYKKAEKITKKQIKNEKLGAFYKVKLGELYEIQGLKNKSEKYYNDLIDDFGKKNNPSEFNLLANEFVKLLKYDLAIKTLKKCDKIHSNSNNSLFIANLYGQKGDHEQMVDSYLNQIDKNPRDINRVKAFLPRSINFEEDEIKVDYLRKSLLKKGSKESRE